MNYLELPTVQPLKVRTEDLPDAVEKEWHPTWKCFCCHDTGWVRPHLAAMVIQKYNYIQDRIPIFHKCHQGQQWNHLVKTDNLDTRLDKKNLS